MQFSLNAPSLFIANFDVVAMATNDITLQIFNWHIFFKSFNELLTKLHNMNENLLIAMANWFWCLQVNYPLCAVKIVSFVGQEFSSNLNSEGFKDRKLHIVSFSMRLEGQSFDFESVHASSWK